MGGRRVVPLRGGRLTLASMIALVLTLSGCGADTNDGPARAAVNVSTFMFDPDPLVVEPGTTVTWTNRDATRHTVTSGTRREPTEGIDATLAPSGGRFSTAFEEPGTYRYFCSRHSGPGMEAAVVVEEHP